MITIFLPGEIVSGSQAERVLQERRFGGTIWVDLESPDQDEVDRIGACFGLHPEAIEDSLRGEQLPRIDEYHDHIFCLCYGIRVDEEGEYPQPEKLAVACGPNFVLSIHHRPLVTVRRLRQRWLNASGSAVSLCSGVIFFRLFDGTVDALIEAAERLEDAVEKMEDWSLAPQVDTTLLADLVAVRPQVLLLRRLAVQEREIIGPLCRGECEYIDPSLSRNFSHVRDHLTRVVELTDAIRERLTAARENYRFAQADRLNEIMKTLTVIATVLLPLSVISGIYGMNVPLWPNPEHPAVFWVIVATMAGIVGGLLAYFRRKRWI